jgi:antitoxin (DNA-binding transcriptional repressor) of toxin-antitoxin stability system
VIHISEAEAASNFPDVLARVRAGAEFVIESDKLPVAVIHAPAQVCFVPAVCWHSRLRVKIQRNATVRMT